MKKRTKVALFAAAAAGVAVAGAKLAQAVQQKNEELNDLIANPVPPAEEEDTSDYVMPGEEAEATEPAAPVKKRLRRKRKKRRSNRRNKGQSGLCTAQTETPLHKLWKNT